MTPTKENPTTGGVAGQSIHQSKLVNNSEVENKTQPAVCTVAATQWREERDKKSATAKVADALPPVDKLNEALIADYAVEMFSQISEVAVSGAQAVMRGNYGLANSYFELIAKLGGELRQSLRGLSNAESRK